MSKNRETIADAIKYIPNFADWLRNDLLPRADENKGIGWIIQAIKNETEDCKKQQEVKKNENLEEMTADNALQILEESGHHNIKKFIEMNAKQDKRSSTKDALSLGDLFK